MNSKNIIIGALILTTIAGGALGWTQYRRANNLQTQVAKLTAPKTSAKRTPRPAGESGGSQQNSADSKSSSSKSKPTDDPSDAPRMQMPSSTAIRNLLQSPKAAPLIAAQQRAMIESRYASLFKTLNLPPDQLAKFKDLLVDKQNAARDVMNVAREQGLDFRNSNDRSEIQQLIQQTQADVDTNIASLIGTDKLAQYQNYDQTAPQRAIASQVEQRMSYTSEPLTSAQSDQLVALLAQNTPAPDSAGGGNRTFVFNVGGMGPMAVGGQGVPITNDVIDAAQSFLSPSQVDALRQMQTEQASQQQLQKMLMNGGGGGGSSSGKYKGKSSKSHHGGGGN